METAVAALLARNLPRARALIRRAVTIGHVDAALMEIALVANGSGTTASWKDARALLLTAAANDPVAAAQEALVRRMTVDDDGAPFRRPAGTMLSVSPDVRAFRAFLTPAECRHLAMVANDLMEPSLVVDPETGRSVGHPVRRCDNAVIGPTREDLVVRAINLRIAAASGTDVSQGEPLTVLRYRPGNEFRAHHDALPNAVNQRVKTMLIYLNDGFSGGETRFLANGLTITPRVGDAVLFENMATDGRIDPRSRHAGLPVISGVKWLATRWIRADVHDPWTA